MAFLRADASRQALQCRPDLAHRAEVAVFKNDGFLEARGGVADFIKAENAAGARKTMRDAVGRLAADRRCGCRDAMRYGILTDRKAIPEEARRRLAPIAGRYL